MIRYAAAQHYLIGRFWEEQSLNQQRITQMTPVIFILALAALTACKIAACRRVDAAGFESLPHPTQID